MPDEPPDLDAWRHWPEPPSDCLDRALSAPGDDGGDSAPGGPWHVDTTTCAATATVKVLAFALNWRSRYDSWFICYGYAYGGRVYQFAWETPYDELHRGFGKTGPSTWYDGLGAGQPIGVLVDPDAPWRHHIATPPFTAMNGPVLVLGRADGTEG